MKREQVINIITVTLASAAVFFLALHKGIPKPFDILTAILIIVTATRWKTWSDLRIYWPKIKPYAIILAFIFAFVALGTFLNLKGDHGVTDREIVVNLARVVFNGVVFLFFAFLVASWGKPNKTTDAVQPDKQNNFMGLSWLLPCMSVAIVASFALTLPAYWNLDPEAHLGGSRLKGTLSGPLNFGFLSTAAFLVAMGLLLAVEKIWQKLIIAAWMVVLASFNLWAASRATWVALVVTISSLFILSRGKLLYKTKYFVALPAIIFLLGLSLLPSKSIEVQQWTRNRIATTVTNPFEGQAQTHSWSSAIKTIAKKPLGLGFLRPVASDGTFVEVAFYGGIGALIFFLALVIKFLKHAYFAIRNLDSPNGGVVALKLGWVAVGIAVIASITFTDGFLWRQTWVLLGISLGAIWSVEEKSARQNQRD